MLRFYGLVKPLGSCRAWSVYLTTLFPGQSSKPLTSTCAHSFARNWQLLFLIQQKDKNDCRKYFIIQLHERMLSDPWGLILIISGMRIRLSHWGRPIYMKFYFLGKKRKILSTSHLLNLPRKVLILNFDARPTSNCKSISLLEQDCWYKFTY